MRAGKGPVFYEERKGKDQMTAELEGRLRREVHQFQNGQGNEEEPEGPSKKWPSRSEWKQASGGVEVAFRTRRGKKLKTSK